MHIAIARHMCLRIASVDNAWEANLNTIEDLENCIKVSYANSQICLWQKMYLLCLIAYEYELSRMNIVMRLVDKGMESNMLPMTVFFPFG